MRASFDASPISAASNKPASIRTWVPATVRARNSAAASSGRAFQAPCFHLPHEKVSEAGRALLRDFSADRIRPSDVFRQNPFHGSKRTVVPNGAHLPQGGFCIGGQGGSSVRLARDLRKRFQKRRPARVENRKLQALRPTELIVHGLARYAGPASDRGQGRPRATRNINRRLKNGVLLVPVDRSAVSTHLPSRRSADLARAQALQEIALACQRRGHIRAPS